MTNSLLSRQQIHQSRLVEHAREGVNHHADEGAIAQAD
jgi:hypothetical protein